MIVRSPLFPPYFFLFLSAWHSVLDLHERSPDRKKNGYVFWERGTISFLMPLPAVSFFS